MTHDDPAARFQCDVEATLSAVGGKWKPSLLWFLADEARRFGHLRRRFPAISQKVLTQQLRELEADGIIRRTVYNQAPARVDYALTDFGRTLQPVIAALDGWGRRYCDELLSIRRARRDAPSG